MDNDLRITAWHEAAHAICGQSLGYSIARVTIEPDIDRTGFCGADSHLSDLASAIWFMSGPYADAKFRRSIGVEVDWRGSEGDFDNVHRVLSRLVPIPRATLFDAPLFNTAWDDAEKLVDGLWDEIGQFADVLLDQKTLVGSDLESALAGHTIRSIAVRREELDGIVADMKRTRRPVSPMRAGASALYGVPMGRAFMQDFMRENGIKIMTNAERDAILDEHRRIMGRPVARSIAAKKSVNPRLAAQRAEGKRIWLAGLKAHAAR